MTEKDPDTDNGKGARMRRVVLLIAVLIAVSVVAVAGYFFKDAVYDLFPAEIDRGKEAVDNRSYVTLEPPFVVNLRHEFRERLLRVSVALLVRDKEVATLLEKNQPMVRNGILLVIAAQDPKVLLTAEGKAGLQAALLSEVRKMQNNLTGAPSDIEDLFFTDFVMQ